MKSIKRERVAIAIPTGALLAVGMGLLVSALLASHPPTAERIGAAVTFAQACSQEPPGT